MFTGAITEIEALADLVLSATLVATMVTVVFDLTVGAVNNPLEERLPSEADQVTAVFETLVGETETLTGGITETVALADLVLSATLVTVTTTEVVAVTTGAVNNPVEETLPADAVQVTEVFEVFETVAPNCWVPAEVTFATVGVIEMLTGGMTETVALADLVLSATLVAVTTTEVVEVTTGAVNRPVEETLPAEAVHVTEVFEVLETVAPNC